MMLTSKPIPAEAGAKLGLVDAVVSSAQLLDTACQLALGIASGVKPRNQVKPSLEHHRSFGSGWQCLADAWQLGICATSTGSALQSNDILEAGSCPLHSFRTQQPLQQQECVTPASARAPSLMQ